MSGTPCAATRNFLENGTPKQFDWMLSQYDACLRIKAESKSQKPENIIKLDKWYQNELPKKLKSRGKDAHLTHDELVQTIKWKLARGKFRPNLTNLIQMNTPRVVMQETKKGLRKIFKTEDVQGAVQALSNLKGVGPAMASAVLAAGAPHLAPFMADEVLLALPDVDCLDYTMKEYMRLVEHINNCVQRLKDQGGDYTPHKVELAVWSYYIANDLRPDLLKDMPGNISASSASAAPAPAPTEAEPVETPADPAPASNGEKATDGSANGTNSNLSSAAASTDEESRSSEPENNANGKSEEVKTADTNGTHSNNASKEGDASNGKTDDQNCSPSLKRTAEDAATPGAASNEDSSDSTAATAEVEQEPATKKLKPEAETAQAPLTV